MKKLLVKSSRHVYAFGLTTITTSTPVYWLMKIVVVLFTIEAPIIEYVKET